MLKKTSDRITLENLAGMINRGFAQMVSKRDLASVKKDLVSVKKDVASVKEDLVSVKKDVASVKEDLVSVKKDVASVKGDIASVKSLQNDMHQAMNEMHTDIRHIRSTVDALVRSEIAQDATIQDIIARVHRLEHKAGLAK